eukprot:gnl/TRDRNA2_/TRDRNA2_68633_c0_seq1.p1 gnl/TRDRNA2_/TRDRNA2_68633_c0~~gnl/TRDRNA2_/TRDRNA2_68633_c0_seq1.p1  ORF type:complete len:323 (-),score=40.04 gnl/TRDRNA2_/TRDRNA2_68633_c0_seq1:137-988(-)
MAADLPARAWTACDTSGPVDWTNRGGDMGGGPRRQTAPAAQAYCQREIYDNIQSVVLKNEEPAVEVLRAHVGAWPRRQSTSVQAPLPDEVPPTSLSSSKWCYAKGPLESAGISAPQPFFDSSRLSYHYDPNSSNFFSSDVNDRTQGPHDFVSGAFMTGFAGHELAAETTTAARLKKSRGSMRNLTSSLVLRGLPFSTSEDDVVSFFEAFGVAHCLAPGRAVELLSDATGRPSGFANVHLNHAAEFDYVRERIHMQRLGTRFIEVLPPRRTAGRRVAAAQIPGQ